MKIGRGLSDNIARWPMRARVWRRFLAAVVVPGSIVLAGTAGRRQQRHSGRGGFQAGGRRVCHRALGSTLSRSTAGWDFTNSNNTAWTVLFDAVQPAS